MALRDDLDDTFADLANQLELNFDPVDQVIEAHKLNQALLDGQGVFAETRRRAVRTLRMQGWTLKDIALATGMSHQRVSQIEAGADRKEKG